MTWDPTVAFLVGMIAGILIAATGTFIIFRKVR